MESQVVQLPVAERVWIWVQNNTRQALWGVAGLLLLGLLVGYFVYYQNQKEIQAGEALSNVAPAQMGGPGDTVNTADAYLKVASEYPSSKAGMRALLLAAGDFFADGKFEQAKAQFQKFAREHSDSPLLGQALLGIAACLDADGKSSEALAGYKDLVDHHPNDSVVPQARLPLARLYEAQNRPELARENLEQVALTSPDGRPLYGSLGSEAGMLLEDLKAKYPSLVAPPPACRTAVPFKIETPAAPALTSAVPAKITIPGTNLPGPAK